MAGVQPDDLALVAHADAARIQGPEKKSDFVVESGSADSLDHIVEREADYPTEQEQQTLRRVSGKVNLATFLIGLIEFAERFSYYGSTVVFTNFIQQPLPPGSRTGASGPDEQSGALGKGQRASTGLGTFNQFWVYLCPLFGAYVADTYLGRYKTICWAVGIAIIGHILLVVSSIPTVIEHPNGALGCFAIAIVIMGLGTGAFKSNVSPLIAEQMPHKQLRVIESKNNERVIEDPALTAQRIFMYFYMLVNVGALVGQIGMVYTEKNVGFWLAFLLPTIVFLLCPIVLFAGRNLYTRTPPGGSVLGTSLKFFFFAARGKWTSFRALRSSTFWDDAKPSKIPAGERPAWMTFDDAWVAELRRGLLACKVFLWYPLYWLTYNQINNNLVSQAATMNTHGLPNDILNNLNPFALLILIPLCDLLIYPWLRRKGINFSPLKRITAGFFMGMLAMICAVVVQYYIYKQSECGTSASSCDPTNLNVWWQTPSYVLISLSEVFASITGLEYAFTKAPKSMRSLVTAVFLFQSALAAAIGEALVVLAEDPLLIWNYGVPAVLAAIGGVGFWFSFRHLDGQERELNELTVGRINNFSDADENAHSTPKLSEKVQA